MPPIMSLRVIALLVVGVVLVASACTQKPDSEGARPTGSPETAIETVARPGEIRPVATERPSPIVCKDAARDRAVTDSARIARNGGRIDLHFNAAPLTSLTIGGHRASTNLTYTLTAEASDSGEFSYIIQRTDLADVPSDRLPSRFTLVVHYPTACREAFATTAPIVLVRVEDGTVIPASAHDERRRTVMFQMSRLSRFVVSH
jgi:hypothetical protein